MNVFPTAKWQPLTQLPLISSLIDGQLEEAEVQLQNLRPKDGKAPILDDALVERIIRVSSEQEESLPVYGEQLDRWKREYPNCKQRQEIKRLERCLERYRVLLGDLLELAREYREFHIKNGLEKDGAEVECNCLMGRMNQ